MDENTERSVDLVRLALGRYQVTNSRGGTLTIGAGDDTFTPVELLLAAIAGCSAIDVDHIIAKRAEPERFTARIRGDKIRDEQGNRMTDLQLSFDLGFADDDRGRAAADMVPKAARISHDRLCTVSRTVEVGTPVEIRLT